MAGITLETLDTLDTRLSPGRARARTHLRLPYTVRVMSWASTGCSPCSLTPHFPTSWSLGLFRRWVAACSLLLLLPSKWLFTWRGSAGEAPGVGQRQASSESFLHADYVSSTG